MAAADPVFHNKVPVYPCAANVLLPQEFTTETDTGGGTVKGAAFPTPGELVHPLIV